MDNDTDGDRAIAALKGLDPVGRTLKVNEASPNVERSSGKRGFGRKRW